MTDLRHLIDLNTSAGDSWMGLTRNQAKVLGLAFILVGLGLADFFTPIPDDVLNLAVTSWLTTHWTIFDQATWFILSYTVIAWTLIVIGAWIYPHNTHSLLNGYVNKFQTLLKKTVRNPVYLVTTLIVLYFTYQLVGQVIAK